MTSDSPNALAWLADQDPERWRSPTTNALKLTRLAKDFGMSRSTLHRQAGGQFKPSSRFVGNFLDLAEGTGASREQAIEALFARASELAGASQP